MTPQVLLLLVTVSAWAVVGVTVLVRASARSRRRRREYLRRQVEGDPLDTLVLQVQLGQIATELRRLSDSRGFAVAHHTRAAQAAYDALLAEACRRAGIPVEGPAHVTDVAREAERLREELELTERGWTW